MRLGAVLEEVFGDNVGKRHDLLPVPTVIGRSTGADIRVDQESVSRQHAEIATRGDGFVLRDRRSLNGTFVNDVRVDEHALASGDLLKVGRTIFRFALRPPTEPDPSGPGTGGGPGGAPPSPSAAPAAWRPDAIRS